MMSQDVADFEYLLADSGPSSTHVVRFDRAPVKVRRAPRVLGRARPNHLDNLGGEP